MYRATITCPKCGASTIISFEPCDMDKLFDRGRQDITRWCSECDGEFEATVTSFTDYEVTVAAYCQDPESCVEHTPRVYGVHG